MINELITDVSGVIQGIPHYYDSRTTKGKSTPQTVPIITCTGVRGNGRRVTTFLNVLVKETSNRVLYDVVEQILAALVGFQNLSFTDCVITAGTDGNYAEISFTHNSIIVPEQLPELTLTQTATTFNQNCL